MDTGLGEATRRVCGETVLNDAKRWYKTYPRVYVRHPVTQKSLIGQAKKDNDKLFAGQNEEWDREMMEWYEERAERYGVRDKLPWIKEAKSK